MTASFRAMSSVETRGGSAAKFRVLGTAVALLLVLAGCAAPGGVAPDASGNPAGETESSDRPFGSDDDAMVTAAVAATSADTGEWRDNVLVLHFGEGSTEDVKAFTNCRAMNEFVAEGEEVELHYPDGVVDCSVPVGG